MTACIPSRVRDHDVWSAAAAVSRCLRNHDIAGARRCLAIMDDYLGRFGGLSLSAESVRAVESARNEWTRRPLVTVTVYK